VRVEHTAATETWSLLLYRHYPIFKKGVTKMRTTVSLIELIKSVFNRFYKPQLDDLLTRVEALENAATQTEGGTTNETE